MASSTDQDAMSHSGSPTSTSEQIIDGLADRTIKSESQEQGEPEKKPKDPKDPSRPRRKKARRACHACQRAHLTCGDERPCQRCIKRGLSEQCCDGVRKKAKYLHDTPSEAFLPGGMSHYSYVGGLRHPGRGSQDMSYPLSSPGSDVFTQIPTQADAYQVYRPTTSSGQVADGVLGPQQYMPQTPTDAVSYSSSQGQQNMQALLDAAQQSMSAEQNQAVQGNFGTRFFDANDLSKFNFDPSTFNFGNHYGALEFGMLGQMATGAAETPPSDSGAQYGQSFASPVGMPTFVDGPMRARAFSMTQEQPLQDWQQASGPGELARAEGAVSIGPGLEARARLHRQRRLPAAIPISVAHTRDDSGRLMGTITPPATDLPPSQLIGGRMTPGLSGQDAYSADAVGASSVYDRITQPYDYVQSWHHVKAWMTRRFKHTDQMRIAKAIADIRPTFIATSKSLDREDLVFQEICFQRTLSMVTDFMSHVCCAVVVCRRTGEIAAVSDEFCVLSGWSRSVLLGEEPNLNENHGDRGISETASGTASATMPGTGASSRGGMNTPRLADAVLDSSKPRPLFLAEIMDDASVFEFYEDFARMSFVEPRGRVVTRVLLHRYRTKADIANSISNAAQESRDHMTKNHYSYDNHEDQDRVDCACWWSIKRDTFENPMMLSFTFLPTLESWNTPYVS